MTPLELASHQVTRSALPWMLAAVVAALLPHLTHLPPWIPAVALACVGWRWAVHVGRASYPPKQLQALFALLVLAGCWLDFGTLAGHEAGTAMLVGMFSLKLLEMYRERDAYVVILIGYFVASTAFLFHFSPLMGLYVLVVVVLFTCTLLAINEGDDVPRWEPLRRALVLLLQSVPVALVLFVVMPRIGPLWSIGLKPDEATTGIAESIAPGDVSKLAQSDELAFRVQFDGDRIPPAGRLYWRALTLSVYDGRSWNPLRQSSGVPPLAWYPGQRQPYWLAPSPPAGVPQLRYTVIMQPTQRKLLFALATPWPVESDVGITHDQTVRARNAVTTLRRYQVVSVPDLSRDIQPVRWLLSRNLQLPAGASPQARNWALQQRAAAAGDAAYVQLVLAHFRDNGFSYTLQPPLLGQDPVDEFLFRTRQGFCEHYASAFVFLMRAAGIPARVVVGYQGGELNPIGNYLLVRQRDAHAWAEIWLPQRGWVEVDPTAVVAPQRVNELGATGRAGAAAMPLLGDAGVSFVGLVTGAVDFINHNWNKWILGYDEAAQRNFLTDWLGDMSPLRIALLLLGTGMGVGLLLALWMFREQLLRRDDAVTAVYTRFCRQWAARGHPRGAQEGPLDYAARLAQADPSRAPSVQQFIDLYVQLAYAGGARDRAALSALRRAAAAAV